MAELARAIALERVAFGDGDEQEVVCSRLERLLRVLFTQAIEDVDIRAARCLFEYIDGRPVQMVAATVKSEGGGSMSADELAKLLAAAMTRLEAWRQESEADAPPTTGASSSHAD